MFLNNMKLNDYHFGFQNKDSTTDEAINLTENKGNALDQDHVCTE